MAVAVPHHSGRPPKPKDNPMEPTAEQHTALEAFGSGMSMALDALAGCLAADTIVHLNRAGKGYRTTVERIALQLNGQGHLIRGGHFNMNIATRIARADGEVIRLAGLSHAWCSGIKHTYELTTEAGRRIRATAEHPFLVGSGAGGWAPLGVLSRGDIVKVNTGRSVRGRGRKRHYRMATTRHHPYQVSNGGGTFKVPVHRLVIEAELNGVPYLHLLAAVRSVDPARSKEFVYLDPAEFHVHHVDHDQLNNDLHNLAVMTVEAHHQLHAAEGDASNVLWQVGDDRVASIVSHGEEITYDIEVADAPHNYIANGFVVHNTGKTSTLDMLARSCPGRRGQYTAFNKAIVREAGRRFPDNTSCDTAHALAFDPRYRRRLDGGRMPSQQLANRLGVGPQIVTYGIQRKALQPGKLAGHVMRAITTFCQSADPRPTRDHISYIDGIDVPDDKGRRTWTNNDRIRDYLEPFLDIAWRDLQRDDGQLPFKHDHYLKLWALTRPQLGVDFLLVDEAQDLSPVMLSFVTEQDDCQLVLVGDANQSIYSWRGSVNAMAIADVDARAHLTQSFRFGPAVADVANWCLDHLPTDLRVRGLDSVASTVEHVAQPRAVLCRTNAGAMDTLFSLQREGRRPWLLGGGKEIAAFARAAQQLMDTGSCGHPDLWFFDSWNQVVEYVEQDPQGDELALNVKMVEEYGTTVIIEALDSQPDERFADVTISTAHKAKGREWESVRLHSDFREPEGGEFHDEAWRLLYVAATRARFALDIEGCPAFKQYGADDHPPIPGLDRSLFEPVPAAGLTSRDERIRIAEALS